jgi:hypothetical protein
MKCFSVHFNVYRHLQVVFLNIFKIVGPLSKMKPCTVPEIIDPVFVKTSQKRSFSMTENERFVLVFVKTGSINSGTREFPR